MKKILQIVTLSELGGAQSVVINLANILCQENDVTVIAGGNGELWQLLDSRVNKIKIDSLCRKISPINDIKTFLALYKINRRIKPEIVHLHSSKIGILGRLIFPSEKIIYTVHGFDSIRVAFRKFLPIEKALRNRAKAIVAVSDYDYNNLAEEGISSNTCTIYNGIKKIQYKSAISLPFINNRKTVLCIARIASPKRFDLFINIATLLPHYNFLWIGNRTSQDGLPKNVVCLGEIPNAAKYYSLVDLCILPSDYEGLPITIIEAMSYGKPVVASNVGGISEIVINDQNGYTVENNAAIFAEKISYILADKDIYEHFSNASFKIFNNTLNVDKMVESYKKLYNQ